MNKEQIQPQLDRLIEESKKFPSVGSYYGIPMEEFTKEELLAIIHDIGQHKLQERKERERQDAFLRQIRR